VNCPTSETKFVAMSFSPAATQVGTCRAVRRRMPAASRGEYAAVNRLVGKPVYTNVCVVGVVGRWGRHAVAYACYARAKGRPRWSVADGCLRAGGWAHVPVGSAPAVCGVLLLFIDMGVTVMYVFKRCGWVSDSLSEVMKYGVP